jgi:putative membrane protein
MHTPDWRRQGSEPDVRFTLANERTFLAWIRTALAVLAGGVLLDQFSTRLAPHGAIRMIAGALALFAALLGGLAYRRWRNVEIAMRLGRPLPGTFAMPVLAGGTLAVAAVLAWLLLLP